MLKSVISKKYCMEQCCPIELSVMRVMVCVCAVQWSSHKLLSICSVAGASEELELSFKGKQPHVATRVYGAGPDILEEAVTLLLEL